MSGIRAGRWTATLDGEFVVFLIGMRPNALWRVGRWWPLVSAMRSMLRELSADPGSGLLGFDGGWLRGGPFFVQYWRDLDRLFAYAVDPARAHRPAWAAFNRTIGGDGTVGIWHETYRVRGGDWEAIYGNMPHVGLMRAGAAVPADGRRAAARDRIAG